MSKRALIIAAVVHIILFLFIGFYASREGMLGKTMKSLSVALVPKEKPPIIEKPKEMPKMDIPKSIIAPKPMVTEQSIPKIENSSTVSPIAAPPAVELPSIQFNDGAKDVLTITDPIELYKNYIEYSFKSNWKRPENINDEKYVVLIQLTIDKDGKIINNIWVSQSGDTVWDNSVKDVFSKVKSISKKPPIGFPLTFKIKFDSIIQ